MLEKINARQLIRLYLLSVCIFPQFCCAGELLYKSNIDPKIGEAYVLMDFETGQILKSKSENQKLEPASLTKLMSAFVIFNELTTNQISIEKKVKVSKRSRLAIGSRMFLEINSMVGIDQLLNGMIVQSGNDAAIAIAQAKNGSVKSFVDDMNKQADILGLKNSNFSNPTGLSDHNHYTTARDMAVLAREIIIRFPQFFYLFSKKSYRYNNILQYNRNSILNTYPNADGMKTGFTKKAGFCLVATATKNGRRLISVVMNANSNTERTKRSTALLDYGFINFRNVTVAKRGETIIKPPVFKSSSSNLEIGTHSRLVVTISNNYNETPKVRLKSSHELAAPIKQGDEVGTIEVAVDKKTLIKAPAIALNNATKSHLLKRLLHSLQIFLKQISPNKNLVFQYYIKS